MQTIVLASSSPFRRELLQRLQLPFETASPEVDETPQDGESPQALVTRLAELKARALTERYPEALIIGSDQVAVQDQTVLGKPGERARARAQLARMSGQTIVFYTGLGLLNTATGRYQSHLEPFRVRFKALGEAAIERYLDKEAPYHCAGSFRSEGLGISLCEAMEGRDPHALIGLPLIALVAMLAEEGLEVP